MAEHEGKALLRERGLVVPDGELARDLDAARAVAARIGYPVALKVQAADIAHKSDLGGVKLNLTDEAALAMAWGEIGDLALKKHAAGKSIDGMLVETMAPALRPRTGRFGAPRSGLGRGGDRRARRCPDRTDARHPHDAGRAAARRHREGTGRAQGSGTFARLSRVEAARRGGGRRASRPAGPAGARGRLDCRSRDPTRSWSTRKGRACAFSTC